jgi:D-tagatose-1,6-bisphosphate aldolase subunit GatZ/KbaZ
MSSILQDHLAKRKSGIVAGNYSVCSAHPWVIRAAAEQAVEFESLLLVEATSNQVNQFGGYTGMRPQAFRDFVIKQVSAAGLPLERLILGGDHLGPNPWRMKPAEEAMRLAEAMVSEYVQAGFTKIHLDASMPCGGDGTFLSDEIVAQRAAQLCRAAEAACRGGDVLVYVIGTEVPTPGGTTHSLDEIQITSAKAAEHTLDVHKRIFEEQGLADVWRRVIALVVQPGVEFGHDSVVTYDHAKARPLIDWLRAQPESIAFEAHSTDYQLPHAYEELIEDGFAILKVGPALTFALREALYALADIEEQLIEEDRQSFLPRVVEEAMLREPADWQAHYPGLPAEQKLLRVYSYSDRIRYYWHLPEISAAVDRLVANLNAVTVPESMWSRYLPIQYVHIRTGKIKSDPVSVIVDCIHEVLRSYAAACSRTDGQ